MPVDAEGHWNPGLFPKQIELMQACLPSKKNLILASGPRYASKTVGALNAIPQHAWNTDKGNICLLTITQSVGIDSGVWTDLTEIVLPEWIGGNFGMQWIRKPYIQNVTKKPACEVSNRWGNKTKITLESLKNEEEVEARFKGKRYSMFFVNELSKFLKRKTFDTLKQALRMIHLKEEDHLLLCDTNPSEDGTASWIYKLWYELPKMDDAALEKNFPDVPVATMKPLRDALRLIEFTIDDNLACSPEKKASLMADFAHSEDLLSRYYYGKWTTASEDAIFYKVFRPKFHVIGEISSASNDYNPEIILPHSGCFQLITGSDPGVTNCASVVLDKINPDPVAFPKYRGFPIFNQLDELVITGADFDLLDFVETLVRKMDWWEQIAQMPAKMQWTHWSDRSVFDMKVAFSDRYWHQHILEASGGRIAMVAAARGKGSVQQRIDLMRKLLFQERYFLSNDKCPQTNEMFKSLKKGTTAVGGIARGSVHKHVFDALTYALASECYDELETVNLNNLQRERIPTSLHTVSL